MRGLRAIRGYFKLGADERRTVFRSLALLPLMHWQLRRRGLAYPLPSSPGAVPPSSSLPKLHRLAALVKAAASVLPLRTTCVTRSLVVLRLLEERGIAAALRIGVRLASGRVDAHAWIEVAGLALDEAQDVHERFAPFPDPTQSDHVTQWTR
jgi:hypothetical protein